MNALENLMQRCHQRHANPLQQRKTVAIPSMHTRGHFYRYKVYCARKYPVLLDDLEAADISFMPIGRAPENDRGPRHFGGELFRRRTSKENWGFRRWDTSWGIQMYTGIPSERDGAHWHDLDFTYQALCDAPDAVLTCIKTLVNSVAHPLLTMLKSGGLRFSCRIPNSLHPSADEEKLYIYKHTPTAKNPYHREAYLKILGENGYSRWDARYEVLLGNLLDPPIIVKEALFAPINALRAVLHQPAPESLKHITVPAMPLRLGSHQLDLAKEAFMKHGFSYVRQDNEFHYWIPSADKEIDDVEVLLWEDEGTVWVRASIPDVGIPTTATPITEVWDDTGIVPPVPKTGLPVTDKVLAVRQGLSPLSIKRSTAILQKTETPEKGHEPLEENAIQMPHVYIVNKKRVAGLFTRCMLSKKTLDAWSLNWQGDALGNFAKTLLNVLEIKGKPHSDSVKAVRASLQSFEWQEEELIRQMQHATAQDTDVSQDFAATDTHWHQLRHFFAHYTRDTDAPIRWNGTELFFWVPPVLHPSVKRILVMSETLPQQHLRRVFLDEKIEVLRTKPTAWRAGNQVFQIRTGIYPREAILDYDSTWDILGVSETGQRFLLGIRAEIERDPNVKHAIIADSDIIPSLENITAQQNVCFLESFQKMISMEMPSSRKMKIEELQTAFEGADVIWIVGAPERPSGLIWRGAQILFGNDEKPLSYQTQSSHKYTDERVQSIYEQEAVSILTEVIESVRLSHSTGKKVVLLTGLRLPNVTDGAETLLFDWEDFEIAGGLDTLPEVITTRQRFEAERDSLTGESSRQEVERIFGCIPRQANRILLKLRDGIPLRMPLSHQILSALADGEKKTAELITAVNGTPTSIKNGLKRLVDAGEIVKIKRGVYALPEA